jgi:hypothetical protein
MQKSQACDIVARELNRPLSRVEALIQRVSEAGLLPVARGSARPALSSLEKARVLLASACDTGLGNAPHTVMAIENLTTATGVRLGDVLDGVIRGDTDPPGEAAFQLEPPAAMLQIGDTKLYFGANLNPSGAVRTIHIPGVTMQAIIKEFNGKKNSTLIDAKSELSAAIRCKADLEKQLVEVEGKLASLDQYDPKLVSTRAHGRDLKDEISSLDNRIKELEPVVSAAEAARRADIDARVPVIRDALVALGAALDSCAELGAAVEQHRKSLREAKLPTFRALPVLQPYAKGVVEQVLRELEAMQ